MHAVKPAVSGLAREIEAVLHDMGAGRAPNEAAGGVPRIFFNEIRTDSLHAFAEFERNPGAPGYSDALRRADDTLWELIKLHTKRKQRIVEEFYREGRGENGEKIAFPPELDRLEGVVVKLFDALSEAPADEGEGPMPKKMADLIAKVIDEETTVVDGEPVETHDYRLKLYRGVRVESENSGDGLNPLVHSYAAFAHRFKLLKEALYGKGFYVDTLYYPACNIDFAPALLGKKFAGLDFVFDDPIPEKLLEFASLGFDELKAIPNEFLSGTKHSASLAIHLKNLFTWDKEDLAEIVEKWRQGNVQLIKGDIFELFPDLGSYDGLVLKDLDDIYPGFEESERGAVVKWLVQKLVTGLPEHGIVVFCRTAHDLNATESALKEMEKARLIERIRFSPRVEKALGPGIRLIGHGQVFREVPVHLAAINEVYVRKCPAVFPEPLG